MKKNKQKTGMTILVILVAFCAISAIRKPTVRHVPVSEQAVKIHYRMDFWMVPEKTMLYFNDSTIRWSDGDLTGYQNYVSGSKELVNSSGKTIKLLGDTMSYSFFFYRDHQERGFFYESVNAIKARRIRVDSMVQAKYTYDPEMFYQPGMRLVYTSPLPGGNLLEKYVTGSKPDESFPDTISYWYDPSMKDLRFSFNPGLDSIHHSKLYRVLFVFNPVNNIPYREYEFRIDRPAPAELDTLKLMKERFLKEERQ